MQNEELIKSLNERARDYREIANLIGAAACRIWRLETLLKESNEERTECVQSDSDDDSRHAWKEREDGQGRLYWKCENCEKITEEEPK